MASYATKRGARRINNQRPMARYRKNTASAHTMPSNTRQVRKRDIGGTGTTYIRKLR